MEENELYKKKILKGVGVFLSIILAFTILSKTVYTFLLPQVTVDKVKSGMIETKTLATGEIGQDQLILKSKKVAVKAPIDGQIIVGYIKEDQKVKKGDILFKILEQSNDIQETQDELEREELQLKKESKDRQKAELSQEKTITEKKLSDKKIELATQTKSSSLIDLEKQIKDKEGEVAVNEELNAIGSISKSQYEDSKAELALLRKQKEELEKTIHESHNSSLESIDNSLKVIESQLATLDEEITLINKKLVAQGKSTELISITSPIDGIVYEINVAEGATTLIHEQLVVIIPHNIPITLSFDVNSKAADKINIGQEIYWKIEEKNQPATIIKKNYDETNQGVVITGEISQENLQDLEVDYRSYKYVNVEVISTSEKYDLLVSNSAITTENSSSYVYTIEKQEGLFETKYVVHKNLVSIVKQGDYMSAITGTLKEKDDIVKNTSKPLREGMEVVVN